jgi:hypothetical protein
VEIKTMYTSPMVPNYGSYPPQNPAPGFSANPSFNNGYGAYQLPSVSPYGAFATTQNCQPWNLGYSIFPAIASLLQKDCNQIFETNTFNQRYPQQYAAAGAQNILLQQQMFQQAQNNGGGGMPGMPSMPGAPSYPTLPPNPGVPSVPGMPSTPSLPSIPGVPSVPGAPSTPSGPPASTNPSLAQLLKGINKSTQTLNYSSIGPNDSLPLFEDGKELKIDSKSKDDIGFMIFDPASNKYMTIILNKSTGYKPVIDPTQPGANTSAAVIPMTQDKQYTLGKTAFRWTPDGKLNISTPEYMVIMTPSAGNTSMSYNLRAKGDGKGGAANTNGAAPRFYI